MMTRRKKLLSLYVFLLLLLALRTIHKLGIFFVGDGGSSPLSSSSSSLSKRTSTTVKIKYNSNKKFWWDDYIEEISRAYEPSDNTDWCEDNSIVNKTLFGYNPKRNRRDDQNPQGRRNLVTSAGPLSRGKRPGQQKQQPLLPKSLQYYKRQEAGSTNTPGGYFNMNTERHKRIEKASPKTGMYLVKTVKAGSSTAAAVSVQIAESIANLKGYDLPCSYHVHHGTAYLHRQKPNFLWTVIREPSSRSISEYFFADISRHQHKYNSTAFIEHLETRGKNFQLQYIGLQSTTQKTLYDLNNATTTQTQRIEMIRNILETYNFIAITERMNESLVAMKLLFGLEDSTIIALSSKRAGGFDDANYDGRCHKIQKSYTTPDVDTYVTEKFHSSSNLDYFLYDVANRSLDKTIELLGRARFERELQNHLKLQKLAEDLCYKEAIFPCGGKTTRDGSRPNLLSKRNCYFGDVGCGHDCVKRVIQQHTNSDTD